MRDTDGGKIREAVEESRRGIRGLLPKERMSPELCSAPVAAKLIAAIKLGDLDGTVDIFRRLCRYLNGGESFVMLDMRSQWQAFINSVQNAASKRLSVVISDGHILVFSTRNGIVTFDLHVLSGHSMIERRFGFVREKYLGKYA